MTQFKNIINNVGEFETEINMPFILRFTEKTYKGPNDYKIKNGITQDLIYIRYLDSLAHREHVESLSVINTK